MCCKNPKPRSASARTCWRSRHRQIQRGTAFQRSSQALDSPRSLREFLCELCALRYAFLRQDQKPLTAESAEGSRSSLRKPETRLYPSSSQIQSPTYTSKMATAARNDVPRNDVPRHHLRGLGEYRFPPGFQRNLLWFTFRRFRPANPIHLFQHLAHEYGDIAHYKIGWNQPQDPFSRASRSTADRTLRCAAGRPEPATPRQAPPPAANDVAMPARDSARSDEQPHPGQPPGRHRPGGQREPRPVRPRQPGARLRPLTPGDSELMAQHQDLGVLPPRPGATA